MPIKLKCNHCGRQLTVPDAAAGKHGKCPKCQQTLRIPTTGATESKVAKPTQATPEISRLQLDSVLDQMGIAKKTGPVCPECRSDLKPGVVVCVTCGFNLQTKQKISGYQAQAIRPEFDNLHLQQAVDNMKRDDMISSRVDKASLPWWAMASFLIGALILCGAGVVLVEANFGEIELAPEDTRWGKLQRLPVLVLLGGTAGITGVTLALFSHLNICSYGFQQKVKLGLACFFLPILFSVPYAIKHWTDNKAPVKGLLIASGFIAAGVAMILSGGGFGKLDGIL
ncbi:MAG: hypothetical protein KF752_14115 [Pirellulaceae bacterium]|nr:hypothetical protein [Pirellulaceae bacterium]